MIKTKLPLLLLTVMLTATLASLAAPAHAGFAGDIPTVTFGKDGNTLNFVEVGNLYVTKGVVQAGEMDRFLLETTADFTDKQGGWVSGVAPKDNGVRVDKDAELRKGGSMQVLPVTLAVSESVAAAVKAVLDGGSNVFLTVTVNLMLVDGKGVRHVLDTVESDSVAIEPCTPPAPTPQA